MRIFDVLFCVAIISLLSHTPPSTAQLVCKKIPTPKCNPASRFRSLSGVCNNLQRPFLGAAETAFRRLLAPDYADGKSRPRESRYAPLPNARKVSTSLFFDVSQRSTTLTHMAMVFGQFLAHDITLGGQPEGVQCDGGCCPKDPCFGIKAPTGDLDFPGMDGTNCIIVRRNKPCTDDVPRQQVNILSSFIDASHIYGVNDEEVNDVRDLSSKLGLLRSMPQNITTLEDLLPKANPHTPCRTSDPRNRPCFLTGDFRRNNENQGLNAMHTIWIREHNRIALKLSQINPFWSGDRLFEETRRIIGAMMQHITYNEFLPGVLGEANINFFNLTLLSSGQFTGYDPNVDPTIPNSMATAALRFGHSTIRNEFSRWGKKLQSFRSIPTKEFLNPEFLYETENGGVDSILRGLAKDEANEIDRFFARAILKYHLGDGGEMLSRGDLVAINIQRAREHGLPGYNHFRALSGEPKATTFADLKSTIDGRVVPKLQDLYRFVDDVDLFVGGILEKPHDFGGTPADPKKRSRLGRTFAHILGTAFRDLRRGDRFWYETNQRPVSFTLRQLRELRKASLARIICDNSDAIHQIQPQVLRQKAFGNDANTRCEDLPFVGLQEWREETAPLLH